MNSTSESLTRGTWSWRYAILLLVVTDLAGMVATFLPMKAVLILASSDVPGFFPPFLLDSSPAVVALVLLFFALVAGGLAWLASALVHDLDARNPDTGVFVNNQLNPDTHTSRRNQERKTFASVALVAPVTLVLLSTSATYLVFTLVWFGVSGLTLYLWSRRRGVRVEGYWAFSLVSQQLSAWLKASALWSMVIIAVLTLFANPPRLGSTAILIAAIFGRRLVVAVAEILPKVTRSLIHRFSAVDTNGVTGFADPQFDVGAEKWPISFFSQTGTGDLIKRELQRVGFPHEDFQIIGETSGPILSLASEKLKDQQLLLRIFGENRQILRDQEIQQRTANSTTPFPTESQVLGFSIARFPCLVVVLESPMTRIDFSRTVSANEAISWQLKQELFGRGKVQGNVSAENAENREAHLISLISRASRLPSSFASSLQEFIPTSIEMSHRLRQLEWTLVPSKPIASVHLYKSEDETINYLGGPAWVAGKMGDCWGLASKYGSQLTKLLEAEETDSDLLVTLASMNANLAKLVRELEKFNLQESSQHASRLSTQWEELKIRESAVIERSRPEDISWAQ